MSFFCLVCATLSNPWWPKMHIFHCQNIPNNFYWRNFVIHLQELKLAFGHNDEGEDIRTDRHGSWNSYLNNCFLFCEKRQNSLILVMSKVKMSHILLNKKTHTSKFLWVQKDVSNYQNIDKSSENVDGKSTKYCIWLWTKFWIRHWEPCSHVAGRLP